MSRTRPSGRTQKARPLSGIPAPTQDPPTPAAAAAPVAGARRPTAPTQHHRYPLFFSIPATSPRHGSAVRQNGWPCFCAPAYRRGPPWNGTEVDTRTDPFSCLNQSPCHEPPSGFDDARNELPPILPPWVLFHLRQELTGATSAQPCCSLLCFYFSARFPQHRSGAGRLLQADGPRGQAQSASWGRFGACGGRLPLLLLGWGERAGSPQAVCRRLGAHAWMGCQRDAAVLRKRLMNLRWAHAGAAPTSASL